MGIQAHFYALKMTVTLDNNQYYNNLMVSTIVHVEEAKLHEKQVNNEIKVIREMGMDWNSNHF